VKLHSRIRRSRRRGALAVVAIAATSAVGLAPGTASAASGGTAPPPPTTPTGETAQLLPSGQAVPPASAPERVVRAIEFANRIRKLPYRYGGGHKSWRIDKGYDCSGAVSYMLHGARMLSSPLPSGPLARWGEPGPGAWISVYANSGHAYAVVAGLRWDTSGGQGPRWHADMRSPKGYAVRHYPGY
jgi:hypothetical protein